jgi:hypothetical protein
VPGLHEGKLPKRRSPDPGESRLLGEVAGAGFEPSDLRVMSPTSYQTALSRIMFSVLATNPEGFSSGLPKESLEERRT